MGVALGGHVIVCGHGRWDRIDTKSTTSQWDKGGKWIWPQVGLTMHCRLAQSAVTCVLSCCENSSPRFIFCLPFLWRLLLHCFSKWGARWLPEAWSLVHITPESTYHMAEKLPWLTGQAQHLPLWFLDETGSYQVPCLLHLSYFLLDLSTVF